jgi:phage terminase large subunit-like protein
MSGANRGKQQKALLDSLSHALGQAMADVATSPPLFVLLPAIAERHPKQWGFIMSEDYHLGMIGGISSGKTRGGGIRALRASYGWIGNKRIETPNLGIVTAPTYPMLRDASLRTFKEIAGDYIEDHNKSEGVTLMKNGSEILWRSVSDPDNARGPNASWWWGDESAMYSPIVRSIMVGRLRQFGALGYDWQSTTPKGRNWLWQTYVRDHGDTPGWKMIRVHSRDNGFVASEFYDELEAVYHGDFAAQELAGMFVAFEGLIYHLFDRDRHVRNSGFPSSFKRVVCGVDWGYTNPGVMLVVGFDGDDRAWVLEEIVQRRRGIESWAVQAHELHNKWRVESFYCDPSEPDFIRALNAQAGVSAMGANNRVTTGIQKVQSRLAVQGDHLPRLIVHGSCGHTISEFEQYQWLANRDGSRRDVPTKVNDHTMDALRYAIMGQDSGNSDRRAGMSSYVN